MRLTFCAACGVTDDLQHHHLVTRSEGDSYDERNLITLCDPATRSCASGGVTVPPPPIASTRRQGSQGRPWASFERFGGMGGRREEVAVLERSGRLVEAIE